MITGLIKSPDCPEYYARYDLTTIWAKNLALEDWLKPTEQ